MSYSETLVLSFATRPPKTPFFSSCLTSSYLGFLLTRAGAVTGARVVAGALFSPTALQLETSYWFYSHTHFHPQHSHISLTQQGGKEKYGGRGEVAYWRILILCYISELQAEIEDQAAAPKIPDMVTDDGVDLISAPDSDCQSWAAEEAAKSDRLRLTMNQDYRPGSLSVQHNLQNHCKLKGLQAASPQRCTPLLCPFFLSYESACILFADFSINLKF